MKKQNKKIFKNIIIILIFGVSSILMLYPFISNYMYEKRADDMLETYEEEVAGHDYTEEFNRAKKFNQALVDGNVTLQDPFAENISGVNEEEYDKILRLNGSDAMGYISIPKIDVNLPIYHGTSPDTLEKGVGHLKGSSFPIGGESTHAVLTGHTGLSTSKMFTDLTKLEAGDYFFITMYDRKLCYQVDQIKVVVPKNVSDLYIQKGEDYCTLVTCTPYGMNSHRLLVRGIRTEYSEDIENSIVNVDDSESEWMHQYKIAVIISVITVSLVTIMISLLRRAFKRKKGGQNEKAN